MKRLMLLWMVVLVFAWGTTAQAELRGHWKLDGQSAGVTPDAIGNVPTWDADVIDDPNLASGYNFLPGYIDNAMEGYGQEWATVPGMANLHFAANAFTVAGWFRFDDHNAGGLQARGEMVLLDKLTGGSGWSLYSHSDDPGNEIRDLEFYAGAPFNFGTRVFTTGQWYHITLRRAGDAVTVHVDGEQFGDAFILTPGQEFADLGTPFSFGQRHTDGRLFRIYGAIDEVKFFNEALSDDDIERLAAEGQPIIIVEPGIGTAVTEEPGPTQQDTYEVSLSNPATGTMTIAYDPAQVTVNPSSINFNPTDYADIRIVTVTAVDDGAIEGSHSTLLTHTTVSDDPVLDALAPQVTVNIADNDAPGVEVTFVPTAGVKEGTVNSETYTLVLLSEPTGTVDLTISPDAQVQADLPQASFNAGNWNVAQTVTVTAFDDALAEGYHLGTVSHTVGGTDPAYTAALAVDDVVVGVADDDKIYHPNLVGMWKCELQDVPAPGFTPDELGAHHGAYNALTFGPGMDGQGLYGDTSSEGILEMVDDGGLTIGTGDFTVTMWTMITAHIGAHGAGEMVLMEKFQGPAGPGWTLYSRAASAPSRTLLLYHPSFGGERGFPNFTQEYGVPYLNAQGHHWALVRSGDTMSVYLDGVLHHSTALPANLDIDGGLPSGEIPLSFGNRSPGGTAPLFGGIDEMRFYNAALDEATIQGIMNDYTPYCGGYLTLGHVMDFNGNCYVDFGDFAEFAASWGDCTDPDFPANCDTTLP